MHRWKESVLGIGFVAWSPSEEQYDSTSSIAAYSGSSIWLSLKTSSSSSSSSLSSDPAEEEKYEDGLESGRGVGGATSTSSMTASWQG